MSEIQLHDVIFWTLPGLVACAAALALASVTLRASPRRLANQRLALVLVAEGMLVAVIGGIDRLPGPAGSIAWVTFLALMFAMPWLYLGLLATLRTSFTRWLRPMGWWAVLAPPAFLLALHFVVGRWADELVPMLTLASVAAISLFAIVASVAAWREAPPGSGDRAKGKAFAIAFVTRDLLLLLVLGQLANGWALLPSFHWFAAIGLLYMAILAYGILKTQLFDIDLRIKKGIAGGTLLAIFAAAFFVAEQLGQQLISERAGPYAGLAGAGALALAFVPLRRLTLRVANRAMPGVSPTPEYVASRKLQVYRAAVEGAFEDGEITGKERAMLHRLAAELEMDPRDMVAVEDDVRAARRSPEPAGVGA